MKKQDNHKAQGILSLFAVIILLVSILGGSIVYENRITANAIQGTSINQQQSNGQSNEITGEVTGMERVSGL